ncbi:MAG TPA: helix-turn-helix domain-containing protein, partial [Burkholderiaceae bacterium]|nr:helix-turn-helix domain-containing protein [Burkholderiaceae bacterium]
MNTKAGVSAMQDGAAACGGTVEQQPNIERSGVVILVVAAGDLDAARLAEHLRETSGAVATVTLVPSGECEVRTPDGSAVDYVATAAQIVNQLPRATSVQRSHSARTASALCACHEPASGASAVVVEPIGGIVRELASPGVRHDRASCLVSDREPHHDETGTHLDAARSLTRREREIVELLRQGFTNKEIGRQLGIMEDTVKKHLQAVFGKLGVHRR